MTLREQQTFLLQESVLPAFMWAPSRSSIREKYGYVPKYGLRSMDFPCVFPSIHPVLRVQYPPPLPDTQTLLGTCLHSSDRRLAIRCLPDAFALPRPSPPIQSPCPEGYKMGRSEGEPLGDPKSNFRFKGGTLPMKEGQPESSFQRIGTPWPIQSPCQGYKEPSRSSKSHSEDR